MGSVSKFATERTAWVAWPLTSFTPKTSLSGKEAEIETARLGEVLGDSSSSSAASGTAYDQELAACPR